MRVLAIDPGGTTGWCVYDGTNIILHGEDRDWLAFVAFVENTILDKMEIDHIVIESYQITLETVKKTRQYEPLMIIGCMYYLAEKCGIPVELQSRNIKAFSTDAKLKNMGWWFRGKGHDRDAARHLLAFLNDMEEIDPRRFLDGLS